MNRSTRRTTRRTAGPTERWFTAHDLDWLHSALVSKAAHVQGKAAAANGSWFTVVHGVEDETSAHAGVLPP